MRTISSDEFSIFHIEKNVWLQSNDLNKISYFCNIYNKREMFILNSLANHKGMINLLQKHIFEMDN
jgi:hypothetical protein